MRVVLISSFMVVCAYLTPVRAQPSVQSEKTINLFDGKTLNGWRTVNPDDAKYWRAKDSLIVGGDGDTNVPQNTYLQTIDEYDDFELRCLFRLSGDPNTGFINSGIQYRSKVVANDIIGYQADIGDGHWGDIYDEHRRGLLQSGDLHTVWRILKKDGWNSYIVRVRGNHHELYINGVKTCDYIEKDATVPVKGIIAFQLHGGGAAKIEIRDVTITPLTKR
ncbi:3-keto-disaccharide hydrolase [Parapedobacter indicus]|uniref:3-keto-alpha-glucoside-1,2-lyase/3-keto-2-hydroxy-glucal hydratase domain-containing protein n=1 Tax=Parapedobacter indicus TaxID=1477437 RepID=A0A1I3SDS5_9SPHI|nr:DUF1080 domain-containing protein [Parapedobacter indicus]PPK99845.1 uncharacterized protein DUF1080 [Parapedobacter indicus]SFJ56885.1 protein of unknown function [Parapedobacter indicus]